MWLKFRDSFKWVAGISGNHDFFGNEEEFEQFKREEGVYHLSHEICQVDYINIAGISGIMGKQGRANRMGEERYLKHLESLLREKPDICVLHHAPDYPMENHKGEANIRCILEKRDPTLVCCGHVHWESAFAELHNGTQVLNADGRVCILYTGI